jgi:hypothetical protein
MQCTLLIPDLLLPRAIGADPYSGLRLAAFGSVLARGTTAQRAPMAHEEWLCSAFGVARQQDMPIAAIMLNADGGDARHHYWLCADPIHLRADRSRLVITGRATDIGAAEADAMIAALNQHFTGDGIEFCAPAPQRWYLRSERAPRLTTTPVARAVNRSIEQNLPAGDDALAWHRVINEAQMILHAHPANAAREERGASIVNSIWLWGGGTLPAPTSARYANVWSRDGLPRALASAAGVTHQDLPASGAAWLASAAGDHHLLVIDGPANALHAADIPGWRNELARLDTDWIAPLLEALRAKRIDTLTLVACNSDNVLEATITRSDLWRFWRRNQPLSTYTGAARGSHAT